MSLSKHPPGATRPGAVGAGENPGRPELGSENTPMRAEAVLSGLKLGRIDYLNCRPLYARLKNHLQSPPLISGNPAQVNQALRRGQIDLSPSSAILPAVSGAEDFFALEGVAISAVKQVQSVILISRRPPAELAGTSISLTGDSLTSVYLLKVLLYHYFQIKPDSIIFRTGEYALAADSTAYLVIGDQALKYFHQPPEGFAVYDLARLWHNFTGLPFVFALWLGRKEVLAQKASALKRLQELLLEIIDQLPETLAGLATAETQSGNFSPLQLQDYWENAISYHLDEAAHAGLELFFRRAAGLKLIPAAPRLKFFP